jgi:hypothetical protein
MQNEDKQNKNTGNIGYKTEWRQAKQKHR